MSHKSAAIAARLASLPDTGLDPHYAGYFDCFNRGLYFEAHDVLEELWLRGGKASPEYHFHKGLIQLAGAFVHLQKERLRPAVALYGLAEANLVRYRPRHHRLDVERVLALIADWRAAVVDSEHRVNPLHGRPAPEVRPEPLTGPDAAGTTVPGR